MKMNRNRESEGEKEAHEKSCSEKVVAPFHFNFPSFRFFSPSHRLSYVVSDYTIYGVARVTASIVYSRSLERRHDQ